MDAAMKSALLSVTEMGRADALTIAAGTPGIELMEAAGTGIAGEVTRRFAPTRVCVLCGPGNNGGDGFVVARRLHEAGWEVRLYLLGKREALKGDAAQAAAQWDGEVAPLSEATLDGCGLVIDALFGAGLSRPLEGTVAALAETVDQSGLPCVAVDIPSGVHGDSGQVLGRAFAASLTVTFFRRKPGHLLLPGRLLCGETVVIDIGIPESVLETLKPSCFENTPDLWLGHWPRPRLDQHKYHRGHAVVVSGNMASTGAARLAARGALRVGAGLVSVAGPPDALPVNAAHLTAIMTTAFADTSELTRFLDDPRRNAVLLGPGNGVTAATRAAVLAVLALGKRTVLDADALTVFAEAPEDLFTATASPVLLTPHMGEFARLFPDLIEAGKAAPNGSDKLEMTRAAARRSGAAVLLKGGDTVIAAPDGRAVINTNAPPELATAGAGDVLAGFALGLMAQGMNAFEAGAAAAWLHGAAAVRFGPGLIAEDLSEMLPGVLAELRGQKRATASGS